MLFRLLFTFTRTQTEMDKQARDMPNIRVLFGIQNIPPFFSNASQCIHFQCVRMHTLLNNFQLLKVLKLKFPFEI